MAIEKRNIQRNNAAATNYKKFIEIEGFPKVDILFEDEDLFVVYKPHNMLSVPGRTNDRQIKKPRHEEWKLAIQASFESASDDSELKPILKAIKSKTSAPRKRSNFNGFILKNFKNSISENMIDKLWDTIYEKDQELHKDEIEDIPSNMVSAALLSDTHCGITLYQIHRLDMDTSGILLQSKSAEACAKLSQQFANRKVDNNASQSIKSLKESLFH